VLTETAPAKINLALHVRARGADGYHRLETLFAFTAFGDTLSAAPADALTLTVRGAFAGAIDDPDNLVLRAARALARHAGVAARAALVLDKAIPVAAGLGGGSADAAAALRLLNRLWGLGLDEAALVAIGATLGADVAACVVSRTVRGEGRGERLTAVDGAGLRGLPVLLVNPRVAMPTGPVFAGWDQVDRGPLAASAGLDAIAVARNDLESPALALAPIVGQALAELGATRGATIARMSGSGATCFALYLSANDCADAAKMLAAMRSSWWVQSTQLL
jgi:4-diphosphocytidyl-2-C-methyl-D-erythritol kinase